MRGYLVVETIVECIAGSHPSVENGCGSEASPILPGRSGGDRRAWRPCPVARTIVRAARQPRCSLFLNLVGRHRLAHVQSQARVTCLRRMRAAIHTAKTKDLAGSLPSMRSASARSRAVAESAGHWLLGCPHAHRDHRGPHTIPHHGFGRFPASLDILDCSLSHRLALRGNAAHGVICLIEAFHGRGTVEGG
jgi:hypothetical protein